MKKIKKYLFLISLLLLGVLFGIIFINIISEVDKLIIKNELNEFISLINKNEISISSSFLNAFSENIIMFFIIWCSGFIFILLPISYFIVFYKGFITGFLLSSLIYIFKIKGLFYFLIFVFPTGILSILFLIFFVFIISKFSKKFLLIIYKDNSYDLKKLIKKYFLLLIGVIIICIILSLLEIFLNYFLIKTFI